MQPHHHGRGSSNEKHQRDGSEIKQRDAFMIGGEKPGFDTVAGIQMMNPRLDGDFRYGRAHRVCVLSPEPSDLM